MHWVIVFFVLCNGIVLGVKTSEEMFSAYGSLLTLIDHTIVYILALEILLRFLGTRMAFFTRGWNIFDAAIIFISLYAVIYDVKILDAVRLLLMFRLVELLPKMNHLVLAVKKSVRGMTNSVILLLIIFYTFSVSATYLYGTAAPDKFADAGTSMFTMLQIMIFDGIGDVLKPLQAVHPLSWVFFTLFLLLTSFSILNLVAGILVQALEEATAELSKKAKEEI